MLNGCRTAVSSAKLVKTPIDRIYLAAAAWQPAGEAAEQEEQLVAELRDRGKRPSQPLEDKLPSRLEQLEALQAAAATATGATADYQRLHQLRQVPLAVLTLELQQPLRCNRFRNCCCNCRRTSVYFASVGDSSRRQHLSHPQEANTTVLEQ